MKLSRLALPGFVLPLAPVLALVLLAAALALSALATPAMGQEDPDDPSDPPPPILDPRCTDDFPNSYRSDIETFLCTSGLCTYLTCWEMFDICFEGSCTSFDVPHEIIIEGDGIQTNETCRPDDHDHIFQCPFDPFGLEPELLPDTLPDDTEIFPSLYDMEEEVIDELLADHDLPSSDVESVLGWARNAVRARLFDRLGDIANTAFDVRTPAEQTFIDAFAQAVQVKRIQAAQIAINEYYEWAQHPCTYVPPEGFEYEPNPGVCDGGTLIVLFDNVSPPSAEEFLAYGRSEASSRMRQADAAAIYTETGLEAKVLASLGISLVGTSGLFLGALAAAAIIFPHAVLGAAASYASVAGSAVIGAAGGFLIVLVLIFTAIMQGIFVFTENAIPDRLNEALEQAQNTPQIELMVVDESGRGLSELYNVFIESTLPDFTDPGPPPAPAVGDPIFRVTDELGMNPVLSTHIHPVDWEGVGYDVRLSGGWFVVGASFEGNDYNFLSLGIKYHDCEGNDWYASRVGTQFNFTEESLEDYEEAELDEELRYLDADGVCRIATVYVDDTPPEVTPVIEGTLGDNDWYTSDVDLSWEVDDPETTVLSTTGCGMETFTSDGTFSRTCEATSHGGTSSQTVEIKRDATAPTITGMLSGTPNANGWFMSDVVVSWDCSDATSGIADCSAALPLGEGADQELTGFAADNAGNGNTDTVSDIDIDKTPPVVTLTTPGDGQTFVLAQVALADWSATDALSGLASPAVATVDDGLPFDTSTTGMKSFVVTATDLADNTTEVTHTYTVLSPEEAAVELIEDIEELDLPGGTKTSLVSKLEGAVEDLENGKERAAEGKLLAFINAVEAQRGKKLTDEEADALIAQANLILGAF